MDFFVPPVKQLNLCIKPGLNAFSPYLPSCRLEEAFDYVLLVANTSSHGSFFPSSCKPSCYQCTVAHPSSRDLPTVPTDLPNLPDSVPGGNSAGCEDVDFDDLTRRLEDLKKKK